MKNWNKAFFHQLIYPILGKLMSWYMCFVFKTSRVEIHIAPEAEPYFKDFSPAIYAFWHGRLLMMPTVHPYKYGMYVLASRNAVGIITEYCVKRFGIKLIRGSGRNPNKPHQDKGGSEALKQILKTLKNGNPIGITPDGPLGPQYVINKGVLIASFLSKKPIIPMTYSARNGYVFNSWDQFLLPFPFTRILFKLNKPISVPISSQDDDLEVTKQQLYAVLMDDMKKCDTWVKNN